MVKAKSYAYKEELMTNLISFVEVKYGALPLPIFQKTIFTMLQKLVKKIYENEKAVEDFFVEVLLGSDDTIPLPKAKAKGKPKAKAKPKA